MANSNIKLLPIIVKHFSTGVASFKVLYKSIYYYYYYYY